MWKEKEKLAGSANQHHVSLWSHHLGADGGGGGGEGRRRGYWSDDAPWGSDSHLGGREREREREGGREGGRERETAKFFSNNGSQFAFREEKEGRNSRAAASKRGLGKHPFICNLLLLLLLDWNMEKKGRGKIPVPVGNMERERGRREKTRNVSHSKFELIFFFLQIKFSPQKETNKIKFCSFVLWV